MRRTRTVLVALGLSSMLLAACGSDDDEGTAATGDSPTTEETTTTEAAETETETDTETEAETETETEGGAATGDGAAEGEALEIVGVNYAFENVPETIAAGTTLSFRNGAEDEAHELVAIRIPDEETRPIEELVQLPQEELFGVFGGQPEPAAVLIAGPGQEGTSVTGSPVLTEPGRYAFLCFIPVGSDPAVIMDPDAEGPPQSDSPPHAAMGMVAEVMVQ